MKKYDVLLISRLDHSIHIYRELVKQKDLKFQYITFRTFPFYFKFVLSKFIKRITYVGNNCRIMLWPTIASILSRELHIKRFMSYSELSRFDDCLPTYIKSKRSRIVHYWPEYSYHSINKWKNSHPETIYLADVYYPNPIWVIRHIEPVYKKFNLQIKEYIYNYASTIEEQLKDADYIVAPSKFVVDTLRENFPEEKYIIVPYGFFKSPQYKLTLKNRVVNFVYVGGISIDKGVDLLLECFRRRPALRLHVIGGFNMVQKEIFDNYLKLDNVVFHGHCSKAYMQDLFSTTIDVGIHLSRYDAYSLAVGEEIGAGLPVVVSNYTGNKDDVVKYTWGLVANIDNIDDILAKIDQICDTAFYNKCQKNIDQSLNDLSYNYGKEIVEVYRGLLKNN
jgi:glycosyltransferase involved in cell wall biosynthesis